MIRNALLRVFILHRIYKTLYVEFTSSIDNRDYILINDTEHSPYSLHTPQIIEYAKTDRKTEPSPQSVQCTYSKGYTEHSPQSLRTPQMIENNPPWKVHNTLHRRYRSLAVQVICSVENTEHFPFIYILNIYILHFTELRIVSYPIELY